MKKEKGFTLIEILVSISIMALVLIIAIPNFVSARARARDSKNKQEARELKSAVRMYYNDYQTYPDDDAGGILGCGANGTTACSCADTYNFAAGGSGSDVVYMKTFPSAFCANPMTMQYYQLDDAGETFCIRVPLENTGDPDIATSMTQCSSSCPNSIGAFYTVCED